MSKLTIGTQVFVKCTQEPCFLLDIKEGNPTQKFPGLSGKVAVVRRPVAGEQGVSHSIDYFTVEEIESLEDNQNRTVQEMSEMQARFKANGQTDQTSSAQGKLEFSN